MGISVPVNELKLRNCSNIYVHTKSVRQSAWRIVSSLETWSLSVDLRKSEAYKNFKYKIKGIIVLLQVDLRE